MGMQYATSPTPRNSSIVSLSPFSPNPKDYVSDGPCRVAKFTRPLSGVGVFRFGGISVEYVGIFRDGVLTGKDGREKFLPKIWA